MDGWLDGEFDQEFLLENCRFDWLKTADCSFKALGQEKRLLYFL